MSRAEVAAAVCALRFAIAPAALCRYESVNPGASAARTLGSGFEAALAWVKPSTPLTVGACSGNTVACSSLAQDQAGRWRWAPVQATHLHV